MNYTLIVLIAYAVIMILATVLFTKKEKSISRFCVGDRNSGWFMTALSIAATWIWAPALFTSTENAFTKGFAGLFWFLVPNVACLILFVPFAKKIRREMPEGITLSGYMADKYKSKAVRNTYLFQLGALSILSTAVQLLAGSKILSMLTGIPFWAMTIIMAAIAFSYSQFSGIKASMLTDAIQMIFMLIVSIGFGIFGIKNGGGLATLPFLSDIADKTGWFTHAQLADMIAVSESTPGPMGVNCATYVGFATAWIPGAVIATLGLVTPSVIIIVIIAVFLRNFKDNPYVMKAFQGIRVCVCVLIAKAVIKLWKSAMKGWLTLAVFLLVLAATLLLDASPILLVVLTVIFGVAFEATSGPRNGKEDR